MELPDGAICVKPASNLVESVLAASLAVRLGVRVPETRILTLASCEGQSMIARLLELDMRRPEGKRFVQTALNVSAVLLMEFINGRELLSFSCSELEELLFIPRTLDYSSETSVSDRIDAPAGFQLSKRGRSTLKAFGRVILFDAICNNWDRLPFVWDNEGNGGNLLIKSLPGTVIAIDNSITALDARLHHEKTEQYLTRLRCTLQSLAVATLSRQSASCILPLANLLNKLAAASDSKGLQIGELGCLAIQKGVLEACEALQEVSIAQLVRECSTGHLLGNHVENFLGATCSLAGAVIHSPSKSTQ